MVIEKDINEQNDLALSEQEVWDVIKFARSISGMQGMTYLNPDLVSGRMKDISLNPMQATQDMLDRAMREPKNSEPQIQAFSQSFELSSMVYKKMIAYLANMLAFDVTYTSNAELSDYSTPRYKRDLKTVEDFLDDFNFKQEFKIVIREMLRNDAYFGCIRNTESGYVLQELPSEYCKITGRWSGGFLFSFNMYWFLQPGVDLNMYPSFFKKKYKDIWESPNTIARYNPALPPEMRDKSSWVYWVDVPVDVGVCFKFTPELATRLPYFFPLFSDLILQPLMRNLQKNSNMASASKMIMGEVPLLNKEAKATVRDSIAISPDLLGKFMALVKSAISESITVASAPLSNIRGISFDTEKDMYDSYMRTTLASSGINTNLIFTSNVKPNAIETQLSLNVDEQMMTALYEQFEDFINYWLRKMTKHFKFRIKFEGTDFFLDRDSRFDKAMALFNQGIVLPQKISAAIGMKPSHFRKHMEEAKANDFMGMLTPPSVEQQKELAKIIPASPPGGEPASTKKTSPKVDEKTGKIVQRGRPAKKTSELGEEGAQTRAGAQNVGRGGKT